MTSLAEALTCSSCRRLVMPSKTYLFCSEGHFICRSCHRNSKDSCPVVFPGGRRCSCQGQNVTWAVEGEFPLYNAMYDWIEFRCKYADLGCKKILRSCELKAHDRNCDCRPPVECKISEDCGFFFLDEARNHYNEIHRVKIFDEFAVVAILLDRPEQYDAEMKVCWMSCIFYNAASDANYCLWLEKKNDTYLQLWAATMDDESFERVGRQYRMRVNIRARLGGDEEDAVFYLPVHAAGTPRDQIKGHAELKWGDVEERIYPLSSAGRGTSRLHYMICDIVIEDIPDEVQAQVCDNYGQVIPTETPSEIICEEGSEGMSKVHSDLTESVETKRDIHRASILEADQAETDPKVAPVSVQPIIETLPDEHQFKIVEPVMEVTNTIVCTNITKASDISLNVQPLVTREVTSIAAVSSTEGSVKVCFNKDISELSLGIRSEDLDGVHSGTHLDKSLEHFPQEFSIDMTPHVAVGVPQVDPDVPQVISTDTSHEEREDDPQESAVDMPPVLPVDSSSECLVDTNTGVTMEVPHAPTADTEMPEDAPAESPVETTTQEPSPGTSSELPEDAPAESPLETTPPETSVGTSSELPEDSPAENPVETTPQEPSADKSPELPVDASQDGSFDIPPVASEDIVQGVQEREDDSKESAVDMPPVLPVDFSSKCLVETNAEVTVEEPHAPTVDTEMPEDSPAESPVETTTQETLAGTSELPEVTPAESPLETTPPEPSVGTSSELPEDVPPESPAETTPQETSAGTSSELPEDSPAKSSVETTPQEPSADMSSELPEDSPAKSSVETTPQEPSADMSSELSEDSPTESPVETTKESSAGTSSELPEIAPAESPVETTSHETSAGTSSELPEDSPAESSVETTTQEPSADMSSELSEDSPTGSRVETTTQETSAGTSSELPEIAPAESPVETTPQEPSADTSPELPVGASQVGSFDIPPDTSEDIVQGVPEDSPQEISIDAPKEPEDVPEVISVDIPQEVQDYVSQDNPVSAVDFSQDVLTTSEGSNDVVVIVAQELRVETPPKVLVVVPKESLAVKLQESTAETPTTSLDATSPATMVTVVKGLVDVPPVAVVAAEEASVVSHPEDPSLAAEEAPGDIFPTESIVEAFAFRVAPIDASNGIPVKESCSKDSVKVETAEHVVQISSQIHVPICLESDSTSFSTRYPSDTIPEDKLNLSENISLETCGPTGFSEVLESVSEEVAEVTSKEVLFEATPAQTPIKIHDENTKDLSNIPGETLFTPKAVVEGHSPTLGGITKAVTKVANTEVPDFVTAVSEPTALMDGNQAEVLPVVTVTDHLAEKFMEHSKVQFPGRDNEFPSKHSGGKVTDGTGVNKDLEVSVNLADISIETSVEDFGESTAQIPEVTDKSAEDISTKINSVTPVELVPVVTAEVVVSEKARVTPDVVSNILPSISTDIVKTESVEATEFTLKTLVNVSASFAGQIDQEAIQDMAICFTGKDPNEKDPNVPDSLPSVSTNEAPACGAVEEIPVFTTTEVSTEKSSQDCKVDETDSSEEVFTDASECLADVPPECR